MDELRCARCFSRLYADQAILDDASRRGISLDFFPLRCRYGHTARRSLPEPPRMRLVPTCGYCLQPVVEVNRRGAFCVNHAACFKAAIRDRPIAPHRYVEIEVA